LARCKGITRNGDQCRNLAMPGRTHCYLSAHGGAKTGSLLRIGNFFRNHIVAAVFLALGIIPGLILWRIDHAHNRSAGRISSALEARQHHIAVGAALFTIDSPDGVFLRDDKEPVLILRLDRGRLLVSATIRDAAGSLVAELVDNEWSLNQNNFYDRNYRSDLLEVRDQTGQVVLQVVDLGQVIHFAGIFHCRSGWTFALLPADEAGAFMEVRPPGEAVKGKIEPICRYPSQEHLGECPGLDRIRQVVPVDGYSYRLRGSLEICASNLIRIKSRRGGAPQIP
jgi:hypothetical protein